MEIKYNARYASSPEFYKFREVYSESCVPDEVQLLCKIDVSYKSRYKLCLDHKLDDTNSFEINIKRGTIKTTTTTMHMVFSSCDNR